MKNLVFIFAIILLNINASKAQKIICYFNDSWELVSHNSDEARYYRIVHRRDNNVSLINDYYYPENRIQSSIDFFWNNKENTPSIPHLYGGETTDLVGNNNAFIRFYDLSGKLEKTSTYRKGENISNTYYKKGKPARINGWAMSYFNDPSDDKVSVFFQTNNQTWEVYGKLNQYGRFDGECTFILYDTHEAAANWNETAVWGYYGSCNDGVPTGEYEFARIDNDEKLFANNFMYEDAPDALPNPPVFSY